MTVYVDDSHIPATVGRVKGQWSHLFADTIEELHEFADAIGLQRSWFQGPPKHRLWHYDVTESMRRKAIRFGARAVPWRESVDIMRKRDGLPPIRQTSEPSGQDGSQLLLFPPD
jgi:Protein of unknown function (DUF4031)